jgi:hypothetical protein
LQTGSDHGKRRRASVLPLLVAVIAVAGLVALGALGGRSPDQLSLRASAVTANSEGGTPEGAAFRTLIESGAPDLETRDSKDWRAGLPDCIAVDNLSGETVGCVMKRDLYASPQESSAILKEHPGLPIYASAGSDSIVGYMPGGIGYVPAELAGQVGELRICHAALKEGGNLSSACQVLLLAQGVRESAIRP